MYKSVYVCHLSATVYCVRREEGGGIERGSAFSHPPPISLKLEWLTRNYWYHNNSSSSSVSCVSACVNENHTSTSRTVATDDKLLTHNSHSGRLEILEGRGLRCDVCVWVESVRLIWSQSKYQNPVRFDTQCVVFFFFSKCVFEQQSRWIMMEQMVLDQKP